MRCGGGEVFAGGVDTTSSCLGEGTSAVLKNPNLASVRAKTVVASSGRSTFHFRARTERMLRVRRAQSQSSAISSRCFRPWMMSLLAVFSGRLSRWIVQAECTM